MRVIAIAAAFLAFAGAFDASAAAAARSKPRVTIKKKLPSADQERVTRIRDAVRQALAPAAVSSGKAGSSSVGNFDVTEKGGKYYLTGAVSSQAQKKLAGERASAAADGREVVNQLTVK